MSLTLYTAPPRTFVMGAVVLVGVVGQSHKVHYTNGTFGIPIPTNTSIDSMETIQNGTFGQPKCPNWNHWAIGISGDPKHCMVPIC